MSACEVAAIVSDRQGISADDAQLLDAQLADAACAPPIGPSAADDLVEVALGIGMTGNPHGIGQFDVRSSMGLWVAVDGQVVPTPIDLPAGPHLVQLGTIGAADGFAAGIVVVDPDLARVWHVAPRTEGARVDVCDVRTGLIDLFGAPLPDEQIAGCAGTAPGDQWHLALVIDRAAAPIASLPTEVHRGGPHGRLFSLGIPIGLALNGLAVSSLMNDGDLGAPLMMAGTATMLVSASAQRQALANHGYKVSNTPVMAGYLLAGTSPFVGGMTLPLGITAGLAQWVANERAIRPPTPAVRAPD